MVEESKQSEVWIPLGRDYPNIEYLQQGSFVWIADWRNRHRSRMGPIELCGRPAEWGARVLAAEAKRSKRNRAE